MRSLFVLIILFFSAVSCAQEDRPCKETFGEDKNLPAEVASKLSSALAGYKLIDRKECESEVYWLAILENQPVDKPRVVGQGKLVVMNKKTREILVVPSE